MTKAAQLTGTVASDLVQDRSRGVWWLLNAPQAVVNVTQEQLLNKAAPELFQTSPVMVPPGQSTTKSGVKLPKQSTAPRPLTTDEGDMRIASDMGLVTQRGNKTIPKRGVSFKDGRIIKRNYMPGHVDTLMVPSGIAINAGIGLLNPFGGSGGYEAVLPSEDDPAKTSNVIGEVAAKYILGRTGNLMPYNEFKEHRPDVSKGEYNAYKAFKWDKNADFDLRDGDFTAPTGFIKGTMDGIHGPEMQFLGRSLPLTTTMMPTAATVAGTVAGAMMAKKNKVRAGLMAGMGSLGISAPVGMAIENERRNRNERSHKANTPAIDPEGPVNYY